jgi:tRNA G10  N-methylase Trm11
MFGTDLNPDAIAICRTNFAAAKVTAVPLTLACCDFRDYARVEGLGPGSATLIITNPPMGRRIHVPNMRGLFRDLFAVAATVLKPGGRLIFVNPMRIEPSDPSLELKYRRVVDLGGFNARLEMYLKRASFLRRARPGSPLAKSHDLFHPVRKPRAGRPLGKLKTF